MTILRLAFLSILSSFLLLGGPAAGKPDGLTIKLIHRDSPASPLYNGNITFIERIQRLVNQTKARVSYLYSLISANAETNGSQSIHPNVVIRAPIAIQAMSTYMVRFGIGTFNANFPARPFKSYHLHMDTGSALTWTDGGTTTGILAQETFTFLSSSGSPQTIPNIVFGCSFDSSEMQYGEDHNQVNGIFGLGWGIRSFVNQIGSLRHGTFSYCLKLNDDHALDTYLRFGTNISQPAGRCIIDFGTTFTTIVKPAYDVVIRTFMQYFSGLPNMTRSRLFEEFFEFCYERSVPEGFRDLPGMTFHLRKADLEVRPEGTCFFGGDHFTSLGAYQQTNQKFIYDIPRKQLQFAPEDCAQNA
ncbi:hypothetical protein FH972_006019 [Carpinus fangiana]|uniref:Peptidase A1 domain-containing protein n=1 Tax=Carpinus fangiana TaxID=176857 RepID=A0A5N6QR11_9ROSI|nr:hypothetical protein FH972_006019 [Carpinus fangiana]